MRVVVTPTYVLRLALVDAINEGVKGYTTYDVNKLIEKQGLGVNGRNRRLITVVMQREFNWKSKKCFGGGAVYYDPKIPRGKLRKLEERCIEERKAARDEAKAKRPVEEKKKVRDFTVPKGMTKAQFKQMILEDAKHPTGDLELYVRRAAMTCGLVRGYSWPR